MISMNELIAFYKVHYNFAALAALVILLALFFLIKGNTKALLMTILLLIASQVGLMALIKQNPVWFDDYMKKAETFDFVEYIWGGSAVSSQNKATENRLQQ